MELRHLRYFLATAREGNMTRAAAACHVSQPALSRQLADLERDLGCELFVRESRGVTLTDDGMMLRKRAEEIVLLADRAEQELRSGDVEVEGDVWIGGGESRAMELVAHAMKDICERNPAVRLNLHSGNYADVAERIDKGILDFGIVFGRVPESRFESIELPWKDRWGVLMRRDDPLAQHEVLDWQDITSRRLIVSQQMDEETSDDGVENLAARSQNAVAFYTLLYNASLLVEAGFGIAVCFDGIVAAGEGTPFAWVPLREAMPVSAYLIWKRFQPLSRAAALFLGAFREECARS